MMQNGRYWSQIVDSKVWNHLLNIGWILGEPSPGLLWYKKADWCSLRSPKCGMVLYTCPPSLTLQQSLGTTRKCQPEFLGLGLWRGSWGALMLWIREESPTHWVKTNKTDGHRPSLPVTTLAKCCCKLQWTSTCLLDSWIYLVSMCEIIKFMGTSVFFKCRKLSLDTGGFFPE